MSIFTKQSRNYNQQEYLEMSDKQEDGYECNLFLKNIKQLCENERDY